MSLDIFLPVSRRDEHPFGSSLDYLFKYGDYCSVFIIELFIMFLLSKNEGIDLASEF